MKKYLLGILAIAMALGFSAFTSKSAHKKIFATTYYWKSSASFPMEEKADGTVTGQADIRDNSVTTFLLSDPTKWQTIPNFASQGSGDFLAAIRFDLDDTPNDGSDGALTAQEAFNAVSLRFWMWSFTLPAHNATFTDATTNSGCVITIKRATAKY